ncbi:Alpha-2-macroglobulin N-terminal domain family protein [Sulfitobacter noctilucicola]|uniref:Apple domain-containing protein n=1 Tax=Sulfitobacter noctilucicola TaxID=1342301 RepID=A0A7W6M4X5_9RHOB|nr:alpha-2-macroglobulin family protein [Sulfitobacter noctilucicola]KIN63047.1 Alpha-2-macroglobulin N-terminal domain family protein [Sulfitobacter noctilucicola]MBB4172426.1 hypothetical protein [Sulfitobacter noctilucicola]
MRGYFCRWRTVFLACISVLSICGLASAENAVPDHRYLFSRDVDFYGADLTNLFDTDQASCVRACSAQTDCVAFTFNTRSKACFPKSAITERSSYEGAISATKIATSSEVLDAEPDRIAELAFLPAEDFAQARRFVATNSQRYSFSDDLIDDLIAAMRSAGQSGDTNDAMRWAGKAVALSDRADLWTAYARFALIRAAEGNNAERTRIRAEALSAATNAYLRADRDGVRIDALRLLASALQLNNRGRDMIPALRLALTIDQRVDVQASLDDAIGKYGFRITGHRVDNNAAEPRICAEFSEPLIQTGADYEPFIRTQARGLVVQPDESQLCIDGVEHGARYTITFRAGLPGISGEVLHKDVDLSIYVRDRAPFVRFAGRSYVLPRGAETALPIETINIDTLDLSLRRVSDRNLVRAIRESYFGRPLSAYEDDRFSSDMAQEFWKGQATVQNTLNVEMTTRLPLADALSGEPAGIYVLSASVPGQDRYETPAAMQWFILSDLGLSTLSGVDGMTVAARSLATTSPRAGIKVSLISRANAVLGTATTDESGFAQFPAGLSRGDGAAQSALLMAQDGNSDIAFLPLTDPAFDLSDRGVEGHPPAPAIDTFLTTDRGAYRVGETIYATALTRSAKAEGLIELPVTAILSRPDGVEYSRQLSAGSQAGGHVFAVPLGHDIPRGAWRLDIKSDLNAAPLASQTVLVEDFLPERIDFDATLPDAPLRFGQSSDLAVDVRYLFGAPGAGLSVDGELRLRSTRRVDGWDGFRFGRHDTAFRTLTRGIDAAVTDGKGRAALSLPLSPLDEAPDTPIEAVSILRVAEGSGRPVERRITAPVATDAALIGIKPLFDDVLLEGAEAAFEVVAVGPDRTTTPMPLRWTVNKVETRYQWYELYGNWEWEPVTRRIRVATGELNYDDTPLRVTAPTEWGAYELVVERIGSPYAASSVAFNSGWYGGDGATDTPDRLEMSLNADTFATGDTATLRLMAEGDGVALISVLSNRVIERRTVPVAAGENTLDLDVTEDWGTGAYITASVLRGMDVADAQNPSRQLGLVHAKVLPGAKELSVSIEAPDVIDGQVGTLNASVLVDGITEGQTGYVTLAAVDVGILNLTGFQAPDVTDHYFGQRRLGVEIRDIYGRLIDGMNGAMGSVRSGGDAAAAVQVQSAPPTEKLMAHFSGPIPVGPDGRAEVEIPKPAFNGTIKLMAIAWTATSVGDTSRDVVAQDPVVVTASLPRFLAPGDNSRLLLELVDAQNAGGDAKLELYADAGLAMGDYPFSVSLEGEKKLRLEIPLAAREIGDHQITVVLTTSDGTELRKELTVPVRDNDPQVATTRQFKLGAGETFTFDGNVFAGLRLGTSTATLTAGPLARFDVPGLLMQLDRYPYGCTEQVTSGAMPLLYLSATAQAAGLGASADIRSRIDQAISRVLARQSSNGSFGMWQAQSGEFWLDAYVADFLSRARDVGYDVPDLAFSLAMDNLRNRISYAPDFDKGGEDIAYALLVLAQEGAANMGDLRYYADTKAEAFGTPMALAQLGAALAAYGDQIRADELFRRSASLLKTPLNTDGWRTDFGSPLRDRAAVLKLAVEAGSEAINRPDLISALHGTSRSLSTQEAAQVLLAAHALSSSDNKSTLQVDGKPAEGPIVKRLDDTSGAFSDIRNTGSTPVDVTMTTYGVPEVAPDANGYGYKITRSVYTMDGAAVSGSAVAGDRHVIVIEVTPFEAIGARLIIEDPLAAGYEIDNPNLLRSGDIAALDWLVTADAEMTEFRADRFIAAVNHRNAEPFRLAYVVRAVTPGIYHKPAATVADMYRPEYRANTAASQVRITP